ncbi:MAG TPA: 1-hydroxycarotenoid 3,4-desaturase CrtD, partial [Bacteroidia bacterium]|nr:1-hydroxycarotenoid 3,4-desaturase CrtD [Bacteroidia bacterium]
MGQVVVIGAGIAGIAVAVRLALKGWQVTVLEANAYPGGKLSEFLLDGFRFDAGPSLFTLPQLVDELFVLAGREPKAHFRYRKLELACKYFWEDGTAVDAWADAGRFAAEVAEKLGVPEARLRAHLDAAGRKYNLTKGIFLERSLHKAGTYLQKDILKAMINVGKLHLGKTMHGVNSRELRHPKLVQLFDRYATYNGSNPYSAPGVLNLIPHLEHGIGACFPEGGMVAITDSLVALARELGVQFEFGQQVGRILVEQGRAVGVMANGIRREADLVVSNMDIVPTYRKLLPDQKAPEKVLQHERSSSALIFYWGMSKAFPQLDLHNIFFSNDYAAEFEGIFGDGALSDDPTVYVHISAKYEPQDAPEGMENWFVMVNVPGNKGQDWEAVITRMRANILAKLGRILGEDLHPLILCEDILDPRSIESRTSSYQGSLYGASSNSQMSAFFRHANFSRKIKGLYFCGGSVHPGGGIPL